MLHPLAGDLALSRHALSATAQAAENLPTDLSTAAAGYGIDTLLLLSTAALGPLVSVRTEEPKQHAGSFPHLPAIFHQAVPLLLHLTATTASPLPYRDAPALYRTADRAVAPERLREMLTALDELGPEHDRTGPDIWPDPLARAYHSVRDGTPATDAARWLWPYYLRRVRAWLTDSRHQSPEQRADILAAAHARLHAVIRTHSGVHQ